MRRVSPSRGFREQGGQMLAGVMVLLAIVFLLGTAMALSVSTSLQQVGQGAAQDAARYGAESAVARGQAAVEAGPIPTADGCSEVSARGSLNGQALQAQPCLISGIDAGRGKVRYSSHAESVLAQGACVTVPVSGSSQRKGDEAGSGSDARAWTTVAWRSPSKLSAEIIVFVDHDTTCATSGPDADDPPCSATSNPGLIYLHCAFHMDSDRSYFVKVLNLGGTAYVSPFVVRDAVSGPDCVATVIGRSGAATAEGDLILPGVPGDRSATWPCGSDRASLGLRNRLLP